MQIQGTVENAHALPPADGAALTAFPLSHVLATLHAKQLTGTISMHYLNLEKHIIVDEGIPVFADSNVAEESLAGYLLKRNEIEQALLFKAQSKSIESGRQLGEILMEMQLLKPYDVFKATKRCFGVLILDAFRWEDGTIAFDDKAPDTEGKLLLKVNPPSLIVRGALDYMPIDLVQGDLPYGLDEEYQLIPDAAAQIDKLGLPTSEHRLARALQHPHTIAQLVEKLGCEAEQALRLIYALSLLDIVCPTSHMHEKQAVVAAVQLQQAQKEQASQEATEGAAQLSEAQKEEIDRAYLEAKSLDYFALLGVERDAMFAQLKKAFLERCRRYSPMSYTGYNLGERAQRIEEMFLTQVKAFTVLADLKQKNEYLKMLSQAAQRRKEATVKKPSKDYFSIKTEMLDVETHIKNGIKILNAGKPLEAMKHFEFAVDVAPKNPLALAHLGFCQYAVDAEGNRAQALANIENALQLDPKCGRAYFLLGRVNEMDKMRPNALEAYKKCLLFEPNNKSALAAVKRLSHILKK